MKNIDILKKYPKTELITLLCRFQMNCYTEDAEEYAEHILWLYDEIKDSAKFWFFKEEFYEELEKELPFTNEKEEPYV